MAGTRAELVLAPDGTFRGSTGCRTVTGTWSLRGRHIATDSLRVDGECRSELRKQDGLVVAVLGDGFRAEIDEAALTATDPNGSGLVYRGGS